MNGRRGAEALVLDEDPHAPVLDRAQRMYNQFF
jgi:hypothetical protein